MSVAEMVEEVLGADLPVAFDAYDGSRCGPVDAPATIVLRSPNALQRILTAPGELGLGRAYVAGDLDLEGDIWAALSLRDRMPSVRLSPKQLLAVFRLVGAAGLRRPEPPPEEARLHGRRHSKSRDAAAISHHYDVSDGPYDAISSIGMFEHVGLSQVKEYFDRVHTLLRPHGRFMNHAIGRPPFKQSRMVRAGFIDRYVFPDGELHEVGTIVSAIQDAGFEVRHLESLREHYALTLRAWVANLEANWDAAVAQAGLARARIWRLYMAASALNFEVGSAQIHQVLATRSDNGVSAMPLRSTFE